MHSVSYIVCRGMRLEVPQNEVPQNSMFVRLFSLHVSEHLPSILYYPVRMRKGQGKVIGSVVIVVVVIVVVVIEKLRDLEF